MSLMTRKLLLIGLVILAVLPAQAQKADQQKEAKRFILDVLARYKNPMSYYPLRRDIFLPNDEEQAEIDQEHNYPKGSKSLGFIVFVKDDSTYNREPFVDANGDILDLSLYRGRREMPSLRSDSDYFRRKQQHLINRYPTIGRFLYFNSNYHLLK